jgi:hypothetical protein
VAVEEGGDGVAVEEGGDGGGDLCARGTRTLGRCSSDVRT